MSDSTLPPSRGAARPGWVYLVGAGPGDAELLTLRAARLLLEADALVYDNLVSKEVLACVPAGTARYYVGKKASNHSLPQEGINALLVSLAREGRRVVRLKGGDPFIFGRGGEEVEALRAANIDVEVVPGISSVLGCAAAAQIPLTHRDMAQAVTFVTGHAALGHEPDLDWKALARPNQTVVVFMGVGTAGTIAARLVSAGRDPATPIAVIENGTRQNEINAFGALGNLAEVIQSAGIQGPALLIIGEVVALAQRNQTAAAPGKAAKPSVSSLWEMLS